MKIAATAADATAVPAATLPLGTTLAFGETAIPGRPSAATMSGAQHSLMPVVAGSISISSEGTFHDTQAVGTQIGGYPGFSDLLRTRKEGLVAPGLATGFGGVLAGAPRSSPWRCRWGARA